MQHDLLFHDAGPGGEHHIGTMQDGAVCHLVTLCGSCHMGRAGHAERHRVLGVKR